MSNSTKAQILRLIRDSGDRGIENYKLVDITLRYGARVTDLRKDGWDIRAKRVFRNGKATGTYLYYLYTAKSENKLDPVDSKPGDKQQKIINVKTVRKVFWG